MGLFFGHSTYQRQTLCHISAWHDFFPGENIEQLDYKYHAESYHFGYVITFIQSKISFIGLKSMVNVVISSLTP